MPFADEVDWRDTMSQNAYDAYLEGRILSADPLELISMLYQGCADAVRSARAQLAGGNIAGRSRAITNASEILAELLTSLDRERGGEIATRLAALYDYMQGRLADANCRQEDQPLAEVLGLLATLGESWESIRNHSHSQSVVETPWTPLEQVETAAHAWSF